MHCQAYRFNQMSSDLTQLDFQPSSGVAVTFGEASAVGWSAKTTHVLSSPISCAMFVGGASSLAPAVNAGAIECK